MKVITTPLPKQVVEAIQSILRTPEGRVLIGIAQALQDMEEVNALVEFAQSEGDDGFKGDGEARLELSKKYDFVAHFLMSAALGHTPEKPDETFPYISVELKPTGVSVTTEQLLSK